MASFWERVLPREGPFTLLSGETGLDGKLTAVRHWNGIKTPAEVEAEVTRLSMLPLNVFYAVGSYAAPNRKDPIAKRCWWLDLDSKEFGDKANATRQLSLFVKATGLPPPSIYVDSGNGLHVYWCLKEDLPIAQWQIVADALKAKCAELEFPADKSATSDPARVLRAPGTLNRKGDIPLACRVVVDNGSAYEPNDIARQLQVAAILPQSINVLADLVSNDDLVSRRDHENRSNEEVRAMLGHINLPPAGGGECRNLWIRVLIAVLDWSDKSEHGFELISEWSAGQPGFVSVDDCRKTWESFEPGGGIGIGTLIKIAREHGWGETVVALPTGDSFQEQVAAAQGPAATASAPSQPHVVSVQKISPLLIACSHAVNARGGWRFEHDDAVQWLANEFVMVFDQDSLFYSLTEKQSLSKTVINDLLTRFMPYGDNHVPITPTTLMRRHGIVNIVNSHGFYPGQPTLFTEGDKSFVNLYTEPAKMLLPTPDEIDLVNDMWDYLFPTEEDKIFGHYLRSFYAHIVQKPSKKIISAPLMISNKTGTGKTTAMWDIPLALVGGENAKMVSNKVLRSQFSDYIHGSHFLYFDEIHINGRWDSDDTANSFKNLITGKTVEVHPKGLKQYNIPNRIFVTATSNYEDAISIPRNDERRWGIYYLKPMRVMSDAERLAYFGRFHRWLESPRGPGVLRYLFNDVDISAFNPHEPPPLTQAKNLMVEKSQTNEVQIIGDAVKEAYGPFANDCWTAEQVGSWLEGETGKTYANMVVRDYLKRVLPHARVVKELRQPDGFGKLRVWCHMNMDYWEAMPAEEVRDQVKNSRGH
jgi:hypothetical protein